jgi:hypothetical protein
MAGLFSRPKQPDWSGLGTFLLRGVNGLDARREQEKMAEAERQATAIGDRLRAQLSPMETAAGAGTGALPPIEQQMAALDEARLLNPAVAEQFAPVVAERQRLSQAASLFPDDPRAQALYGMGNQSFLDSVGEQYKPQVIAEGGLQSVYGARDVVRNPRTREFGIQLVRDTPEGVEVLATRGPTYAEQTQRDLGLGNLDVARDRLSLDRDNSGFTLSPGAQRFDAQGNQVASVAPATDPQAAERQQRASQAQQQQISSVRSALDRARGQIGFWTTGPLAGLASIGGTPAADLAATIDTIEANLSFQALADMRANSPTGGALGSITERELQLLGSTVASLRQSQSPQQLRENLSTIERTLDGVAARSAQAAPRPAQSGGGPRVGAVEDGYQFLGGNPANPSSWRRVQ